MPIQVFGLNHLTTTLDMRGRLTVSSDDLHHALTELRRDVPDLAEVAILSTCNRIEIHAYSHIERTKPLVDWLARSRSVPSAEFQHSTYHHTGQGAAAHAMRVASGLDSQILGEPQIQGQFKVAYQHARECGTLGKELGLLENFALQTAKRIRTETQIGAKPVSVAYATIKMAKQIFADFESRAVLLIGAGSNMQLIARYLYNEGASQFTIANRTRSHAEALAQDLDGTVIGLDGLADRLHEFDIVVSSTGSPHEVLSTAMLTKATKRRRHKAMFIADLAVPRDVEATASAINDIYLYTVDDLSKIVSQSLAERQELTSVAEGMIADGVTCYIQKRRVQLEAALLATYRANVDSVRKTTLAAALKKLDAGEEASDVLTKLAYDLTKQLAHKPTMSIRQASASGNEAFLHLLKDIYELEN